MPVPTRIRRWGLRLVYLVALAVFTIGLRGVWDIAVVYSGSCQQAQTSSPSSSSSSPDLGSTSNVQGGNVADDIFNSTLGFGKILVLNLPARTDRRDSIALAAALSGLDISFIEGKKGPDIADKALPSSLRPGAGNNNKGTGDNSKSGNEFENQQRKKGLIGCWRGHVDALLHVVRNNLTTALILEDDADWDVRVRESLSDSARATRAWLWHNSRHRAETPYPITGTTGFREVDGILDFPLTSREGGEYSQHDYDEQLTPGQSPYGQSWDLLHLGHCGSGLPLTSSASTSSFPPSPLTPSDEAPEFSVSISNDSTVPVAKHLRPHPFARRDKLGTIFPPHTRLVQRPVRARCAQGYAVTQAGARKLLYRLGVYGFGDGRGIESMQSPSARGNNLGGNSGRDGRRAAGPPASSDTDSVSGSSKTAGRKEDTKDTKDTRDPKSIPNREGGYYKGAKPPLTWRPFDYALRDWCDGYYAHAAGGERPLCLAPNPPIFSHYYAPGGSSDILGIGGGYVTKTGTPYVRWSVRGNTGVLAGEEGGDVKDGWPDEGKGVW